MYTFYSDGRQVVNFVRMWCVLTVYIRATHMCVCVLFAEKLHKCLGGKVVLCVCIVFSGSSQMV